MSINILLLSLSDTKRRSTSSDFTFVERGRDWDALWEV